MRLPLCFIFLTIFGILTAHTVQTWTSGLYNQGIPGFSGTQGISVTPTTPGVAISPTTSGISVTPGYPGYSGTSRVPGFSGISVTPTTPGVSITPTTPGISVTPGYPGYSGTSRVPGFSGITVTPTTSGLSVTPGYPGYSGTSRIPGYSGIHGTLGAPGISVAPGYPGYLGTSKIPGFSGISGSPIYPYGYNYEPLCRNQITNELALEFTNAIYQTATYLFKKAAAESDNHFISSPFTTWLALAAIAEGAEESMKQRLFSFLNLPRDRCVRQLYYKLATAKEISNNELLLQRNHQFIFDSSVRLNPIWQQFVTSNNLIDITSSPFKTYPEKEAELFRNVFNTQLPNLNLNGNSIILESLDYRGLWTTAFADATIESGPFYNAFGEQIGTIEYMKTRTPANMAYLPEVNLKIIELPVGSDQRYKLLIGLTVDVPLVRSAVEGIKPTVIFDILSNLRLSPVSVEVVVPRMMMTSEVDVKKLLEDLNIDPIWEDPIATSNISTPSALPSSYIQRITATIDSNSIQPSTPRFSNFVPPLPQQKFNPFNTTIIPIGGDFIANRPFLFGLIRADNYYIAPFAGAFSKINN